jgi:uncharacterized protein YjdB
VTATSNAGNASATALITVNPLPAASVVASGTLTCTQPSVGLTAQGGAPINSADPACSASRPIRRWLTWRVRIR